MGKKNLSVLPAALALRGGAKALGWPGELKRIGEHRKISSDPAPLQCLTFGDHEQTPGGAIRRQHHAYAIHGEDRRRTALHQHF